MEVEKVRNSVYKKAEASMQSNKNNRIAAHTLPVQKNDTVTISSVAFKGASNRLRLLFRQLSNYMKEPSEMISAEVAFIGTGGIAPFAIMCSPKKKDENIDPQKDREKKMFQALRQPVSAALAFGFQVPTTLGIAALFNHLAYEKDTKFFYDEKLDKLIPDKKYLKKQAEKIIKGSASEELKSKWGNITDMANNFDQYKPELIEELRQERKDVGIDISDEELEKMAEKPKRKNKFLAEKMAEARREVLINEKVAEIAGKPEKLEGLKDIDFVTEEYQKLAKNKFKEDFKQLRENANLNWFDKTIEYLGFSNGKLKKLEEAEKELSKEKGLQILKEEMPNVFGEGATDTLAKIKNFVKTRDVKAQKLFNNKVFFISLLTNLIMVGISCVALNAFHPKFAAFVDKLRGKKPENAQNEGKKVEVRA